MYLRICPLICCAILIVGFATAAQSGSARNSDITFDDDHLEGSGNNGEVSQDLAESSGSGFGPDDEDTPSPGVETRINQSPHQPPDVVEPEIVGPKHVEPVDNPINKLPVPSSTETDSIVIMNPKSEDRHTPFFAQPGILAAVIGGAVVGLLCAILVVMFIVYRMRKKDEGSYALGEPKQSPNTTSYSRGNSKEFYA